MGTADDRGAGEAVSEHKKLSIDEIGREVLTAIIAEKLVQVTSQGTMQWAENAPVIIGQAVRAALMNDSEQDRVIQSTSSDALMSELLRRHDKVLAYLETPTLQTPPLQANGAEYDGDRLLMLRFKPNRMTGIGIAETVKAMLLTRELACSIVPQDVLPQDGDLDDGDE